MSKQTMGALVLAMFAGQAMGQVTVDGQLSAAEESLYTLNWLQNQPTSFGDNTPQTSTPDDTTGAGAVTTGVEMRVPLANFADDMGNIDQVRVIAWINSGSHDFASNQWTGGLGNGVGNIGDPRFIDANDATPGNPDGLSGVQTLDITSLISVANAPMLDGSVDASYGAALFTQTTGTGFGDSDDASAETANGSEIAGGFGVIVDNNGDGLIDAGDDLYIIYTGNIESNFNKFDMFFDTIAGEGQAQLRGDNPDVDFNGLNRMGDDGSGNGLVFEAGFESDFYITYTIGDAGDDGTINTFANLAQTLTAGGGTGLFIGEGVPASLVSSAGVGDFGAGIEFSTDNSNVAGVGPSGFVPPAPDPDFANGSEINALYTNIDNGTLNIFLAGNLETNFNRLYLFLDGDASEGQNVMRNDNLDVNFNRLNRLGSQEFTDEVTMEVTTTPGLTWDADFSADYTVFIGTGNNPVALFADASVLRADGPLTNSGFVLDYGSFDGGAKNVAGNNPVLFDGDSVDGTFTDGPVQTPTGPETPRSNYAPRGSQLLFPSFPAGGLLQVAIDNSNIAGINSTDDAMPSVDGAADVDTGIEISIDLEEAFGAAAAASIAAGDIKIAGFIVNTDGTFVSNQVIGGLPAVDQLGEPSEIDFSMIDGDQFVRPTDMPMTGPTRLCADQNGDDVVNGLDFGAWLGNFNAQNPLADVNQDNAVNGLDFGAWLGAFNAGVNGPLCP